AHRQVAIHRPVRARPADRDRSLPGAVADRALGASDGSSTLDDQFALAVLPDRKAAQIVPARARPRDRDLPLRLRPGRAEARKDSDQAIDAGNDTAILDGQFRPALMTDGESGRIRPARAGSLDDHISQPLFAKSYGSRPVRDGSPVPYV